MSSDEIIQGFTTITSIHGLLRICSPERRWCARGIWTILFVLANAAFIYQAQLLVSRYISYPSNVQTSLEFKMLPFPSVTICNQNPIRLSKINSNSTISLYQKAYVKLFANNGDIGEDEWESLCETQPLLCAGISYEKCTGDGACEFDYYELPEDGCYDGDYYDTSSECNNSTDYSNNVEEGSGTLEEGSGTLEEGSGNLKDGSGNLKDGSGEGQSRRKRNTNEDVAQISLSMLQINSKANSDMNYILFNALNSNNEMLLDHYKDAYVDIYEFMEDCSFGTRKCNIDSDFVPILNSVYGQCFTFNHIDANMTDMTVSRAGPAFGLRLRLNIKQEDYLYSTDTAGARITVHNKGEQPFPETIGYSAKVGTRTSVGITVVETLRLPAPWGNCTSNSDIRSRVPYFYQGSYTSQGCVFSCLALKMAESCGCLHQNYPKPSGMITINVDNKTTTVESSQLPYCNMTTKACADNAETNLLGSGEINSESCGCHPACHSNDYQAAISMSSFPSDKYLETTSCPRSDDSDTGCYDDVWYNQLQVEVFYEQLNFHRFKEEEAYSTVQLLSDLGGQLGLWIGASLLSIAEFISFCLSIGGFLMRITKGDVEMKRAKIESSSSLTTVTSCPSIATTATSSSIYEKPAREDFGIDSPPKPIYVC